MCHIRSTAELERDRERDKRDRERDTRDRERDKRDRERDTRDRDRDTEMLGGTSSRRSVTRAMHDSRRGTTSSSK